MLRKSINQPQGTQSERGVEGTSEVKMENIQLAGLLRYYGLVGPGERTEPTNAFVRTLHFR